MTVLSRDAIVRGLMEHGFSRDQAEAGADRELAQLAVPRPQRFGSPTTPIVPHPGLFVPSDRAIVPPAPAITWPVRLTLPWSLLVSDNERKEPYVAYSSDGPVARMRLTRRYADAKEKIEQLARFKLASATPAELLLELTARVWVPGGRVGNDVANFGKGVHDALEKIVYRNDNQLRATHWLHAGVDVDAPRAEITLTPFDP